MPYRKGRSAEDIITTIIPMLKEANKTGDLVALIMEDEEKFFDRVTHKLQAATLTTGRIPPQGWIEIKAEDMSDRKCTLITIIG